MSINKLREHLDMCEPVSPSFSANEIDEALVTTYQIIDWAVQDQCDTISVTSDYAIWSQQDIEAGRMPTPVSFRPYFEKVLDRDKVIQGHMLLVAQTAKEDVYKITWNKNETLQMSDHHGWRSKYFDQRTIFLALLTGIAFLVFRVMAHTDDFFAWPLREIVAGCVVVVGTYILTKVLQASTTTRL